MSTEPPRSDNSGDTFDSRLSELADEHFEEPAADADKACAAHHAVSAGPILSCFEANRLVQANCRAPESPLSCQLWGADLQCRIAGTARAAGPGGAGRAGGGGRERPGQCACRWVVAYSCNPCGESLLQL